MNLQLVANEENQDRAQSGKNEPGGMIAVFAGRENMWVTPPPNIEPMMPSTIVQEVVICACITDFAMTPEISPMRTYQIM